MDGLTVQMVICAIGLVMIMVLGVSRQKDDNVISFSVSAMMVGGVVICTILLQHGALPAWGWVIVGLLLLGLVYGIRSDDAGDYSE